MAMRTFEVAGGTSEWRKKKQILKLTILSSLKCYSDKIAANATIALYTRLLACYKLVYRNIQKVTNSNEPNCGNIKQYTKLTKKIN